MIIQTLIWRLIADRIPEEAQSQNSPLPVAVVLHLSLEVISTAVYPDTGVAVPALENLTT